MRMSWKLGRVAGIDLFLHPTTLLIVLAYVGILQSLVGSILLVTSVFGCVLLHELGHALMARRYGIETEDITLYPIGGVARLRRMPKSPGAELAIALAGPAVNVVIAMALAAFLTIAPVGASEADLPLFSFAAMLLQINIGLAVFNMIPAFPMDGGRVFRALLSGWLGRERATVIAAGVGRGLALAFGLYALVNGMIVPAFLALFVYLAAGMELAQVLAERGRRDPRDRDDDDGDGGVWDVPPGFYWAPRGQGVWQLAPISVHASGGNRPRWR